MIIIGIFYNQQRKKGFITKNKELTYKEIVNFDLTYVIFVWVSIMLMNFFIGMFIFPIVLIVYIITLIKGYISHLNGEPYKYLWSFNFFEQ